MTISSLVKKQLLPTDIVGRSLRGKFDLYNERVALVEAALLNNPKEWGRFQNEFNTIVNFVFLDIMNFVENNGQENVDKLRRIFVSNYRELFLRGDLNARSLSKPYGYAGDFEIIDDIYLNQPKTSGFDRLFDNYFQMSSISNAVRNRKEDFKHIILEYVKGNKQRPLRMLDLASGPARELKELSLDPLFKDVNIEIDCFDHDSRSLEYARRLLSGAPIKVNFEVKNALKIGAAKDVSKVIPYQYDFIFSTGLFDYLNEKVTTKLIRALYSRLKSGGVLAISDVRNKHSNPSVYYMEWVGEWALEYNDDDEFRSHCLSAGIKKEDMKFGYEQQGILQYVLARR